jgi:hypothetical protein
MDCHRGNKGPAKGGSDTRVKSTCLAVKGSPSLSPSRALTRGGLGLNRRGEWQCSGVGDSSPQLCHYPSNSTPSLALEYQVASANDGGRGSSESAFCSSVKCEDPLVRFSRVTIVRRTEWRSFVEAASPSDSSLPPCSEIVMSGDCPLVWHALSTFCQGRCGRGGKTLLRQPKIAEIAETQRFRSCYSLVKRKSRVVFPSWQSLVRLCLWLVFVC